MAFVVALSACGSSGSNNKSQASTPGSSSSQNSSSASSVTDAELIMLAGTITYDYVPHKSNNGLNYLAIEQRPVRGAVIEMVSESGAILGSSITASDGSYSFSALKNTLVGVRVKAELLHGSSPSWDFRVTDNTHNNALYTLTGALASTGNSNSTRNLNAASGWGGTSYSSARAAAPFAILDDIYIGVAGVNQAGNSHDFKPIELRWSTKNNEADGNYALGEIGTTFFDDTAIYILGDANNDTDEYDGHVILHEWGHYIEQNFSRSDSVGGAHASGETLDMRLSMSEGFANAFSAMMLNNPIYTDSSGSAQNSGFASNIGNKVRSVKGFFSEGSIGSIFYNYYNSSNNKTANDFTPIFSVLNNSSYFSHEAMTSVFLFYGQLKALLSDQATAFNDLMLEQNINGTDEYGTNESNDGGLAVSLPVYKTINPDNAAINICSSPEFGKFNRLANSQLLKLTISQAGSYGVKVTKAGGGADAISKPEIIVYNKGQKILAVTNTVANNASGNLSLSNGVYILEVYDLSNHDSTNTQVNTFCFNVQVMAN